LWQSHHELAAARYTRGQILSPTKLWHQFIVYPLEIAASIAVGSTLRLVNQSRKRRTIDEERLRPARGTH
jgi:hypothetical protein